MKPIVLHPQCHLLQMLTCALILICAVLEEQKSGVQKEASDLRTSLHEVEKARMEARRELQELRRTAKVIDGERSKLAIRVNELMLQVSRDEEKEEEARKENFSLKQKV
jgi:rootletin